MLDCPEPIQTSPTRTSAIVRVFVPRIVISAAGPGFSGLSHTSQRPTASVTVCAVWPRKATLTDSPGSALPKTRTGMSRCSNMWSLMMPGSRTSAEAGEAIARQAIRMAAGGIRVCIGTFYGACRVFTQVGVT